MVRPYLLPHLRRFPAGGICRFGNRIVVRGFLFAARGCVGMVQRNCPTHGLLLFDFPDGFLSPYRIHGESLSWSHTWFYFRRAKRTLVACRRPRRVLVDDAREWD